MGNKSEALEDGGMFIYRDIHYESSFIPEDFTSEHKQIGKAIDDFIKGEIASRPEEIESHNFDLSRILMQKCGDLGFLGIDIPEDYGGMALDKMASILVSEKLGYGAGSFALTELNHTGIGTLPVALFGTESQKKKYLPGLTTGRLIGAFGLTEPEAGSDALNSLSTAVLSKDGRYYILNGTKQFITNAGFADIVFAYAKVDGEHFTAFIVEQQWDGVSTGPEEDKMGWHGTSTRAYHFDNVKVPVENVLGEVGKGHVVALNALNMGRFKVGAICIGNAKKAFDEAVQYAKKRKQFGKAISEFGLIQEKISKTAVKLFAAESMMYRIAGMIQRRIDDLQQTSDNSLANTAEALKDYVVECSINKIFGSETEDYVVDEEVQVFGGYAYIRGYHPEMAYRHARPNRIWEGTNEINRIVIVTTLFRKLKALNGDRFVDGAALQEEVNRFLEQMAADNDEVTKLTRLLHMAKRITAFCVSVAYARHGSAIRDEQAMIGILADMIIENFAMESVLARCLKISSTTRGRMDVPIKMAQIYFVGAIGTVTRLSAELGCSMFDGQDLKQYLNTLQPVAFAYAVDQIAVRKSIAAHMIQKNRFAL